MKPLSCFVTKSSFCWLRDNTPSVMDKVGAILNWLGPKSFEVYEDLVMEPGEDKRKCEDVLKAFERYFKPTQSLFQNWYQLGGLYSGSCKSQGDFMK